jgi:hypothetical protein
MAAGLGFKTFTTGEVLTAGDVNGYLMQGINVFTNATARDAAITAPAEGQFAFTKDNNSLWYYDGAAWVASGATGDIEGVTAGVGISGGGTSGTVTVTNSMATAIDAKGDLVPGTGADTFSRLAVGANDTVLTADSSTATGLKWATSQSMTLLNAGGTTLSGASTSVSFTSTGYTGLKIILKDVYVTINAVAYFTLNNDGASNYSFAIVRGAGSVTRESNDAFGAYYYLFQQLPTTSSPLLNGNGQIDLFFPTDTDNVSYTVNTLGGPSGGLTVSNGMGTYNSSAAISRFDIFIASGSFSGGKIFVYGVK